mgnify:FL=1
MTSKLKTDVLETVSGSGTIALTNQLSGMTSASMPSGSVIKVERSATAADGTTTSQSDQEILTHNYTPVSSSSKIYVQVFFTAYNNNTNTTAGMRTSVKRAGVNIGIADKIAVYTSTTADRFQAAVVVTGEYTNSSTTAADFELWIKSFDGGAVVAYDPYMIITEVAN